MSIPDTVYKYCDQRGIDIVENLRLIVTPPNQFNDPFELTPHALSKLDRRTARHTALDKDGLRKMYEAGKASGKFAISFREFRNVFKQEAKSHAISDA